LSWLNSRKKFYPKYLVVDLFLDHVVVDHLVVDLFLDHVVVDHLVVDLFLDHVVVDLLELRELLGYFPGI
jgi:hypothetical protein